jgi:hypothetical protein
MCKHLNNAGHSADKLKYLLVILWRHIQKGLTFYLEYLASFTSQKRLLECNGKEASCTEVTVANDSSKNIIIGWYELLIYVVSWCEKSAPNNHSSDLVSCFLIIFTFSLWCTLLGIEFHALLQYMFCFWEDTFKLQNNLFVFLEVIKACKC